MADINIKIKLEAQRAAAQMAKFTAQVDKAKLSVEKARLQNSILEQRLKKTGDQANKAANQFKGLSGAVNSFIGNLGANAVSKAFNFVGQSLKNGLDNAISYEKALIGVGRTANLTAKDQALLAKEVGNLTKVIPLSNQELLKFSQIAGQLGVSGVDEITSFTETFAKLSVATNISGEESAIAFTKILGLTDELGKDGAKNIAKLGSVITALGNDAKALETDIVSVGLEVAKGLAPFKLGSETILAFATSLSESGVASEAAGSSLQRVFQEMASASEKGGKSLENFAKATGVTTDEFKKLFEESPDKAFLKLAESLSKAGLSPGQLIESFENLGLKQIRVQRSLIPLVTNYAKLSRNVDTANKEAKTQTALNAEAAKAFKTLGSDVARTTEAFNSMVRTLIQTFQPAISLGLKTITSFFNAIRESVVLQGLAVGLGVAATAFTVVAVQAVVASGAFSAVATAAAAAWIAVTGPVGLVILAIAAVSAAVFILVKKWNSLLKLSNEWLGTSFKINEANEKTKKQLDELAKGADKNTKEIQKQNDVTQKKIEIDKSLAESTKVNEDVKKKAIQDRAAAEAEIREAELQASLSATEQNNAEYVQRFQDFTNFSQGKLAAVQEFFTLEEQVLAEGRLLSIENDRLLQVEKENLATEGFRRRLKLQIENSRKLAQVEIDANKIIAEDNKELAELREKTARLTVQKTGQFFGAMADLARTGGKRFFEAQKAFSIAQVIINGIQQVSEAAKLPYPANIPAVAFAVVDSAARTAAIASQQPRFENGGIVGGSQFSGDQVQARVNSGEMILNRQQQNELFQIAQGQSQDNQGGREIVINSQIMLNDDVVGEAVSRWSANGGQIGEVQ